MSDFTFSINPTQISDSNSKPSAKLPAVINKYSHSAAKSHLIAELCHHTPNT